MEAAARDPGYRPDPPSSPRHPDPAGNQPVGKPAAQRTPGADAESPPPARRPGRDPGHIAPNNGIPVSPALPPPCNAMPPMRRPQMPKDTAQTTPRGSAAERPDEGASGDENHNVKHPPVQTTRRLPLRDHRELRRGPAAGGHAGDGRRHQRPRRQRHLETMHRVWARRADYVRPETKRTTSRTSSRTTPRTTSPTPRQ